MARLTNKQKFDILANKIVPLGLRIVNGGNITEEDYSTFDNYARELWLYKSSVTLKEDDILSLQFFVALVYRCVEDRKNALTRFFFKWTC